MVALSLVKLNEIRKSNKNKLKIALSFDIQEQYHALIELKFTYVFSSLMNDSIRQLQLELRQISVQWNSSLPFWYWIWVSMWLYILWIFIMKCSQATGCYVHSYYIVYGMYKRSKNTDNFRVCKCFGNRNDETSYCELFSVKNPFYHLVH